ncbi:MAG TPA: nuclear transport factor 2 family protein [Opitutaceae bacterium]|nr:nuclear transport factor 2 family protein [Opitutaceae bacterium]
MNITPPIAALAVLLSFGQSTAKAQDSHSTAVVLAITQLEHEWADALVAGDTVLFDRIEDPDYLLTDPDGVIFTVAEVDSDFKSGAAKYTSFHFDDLKVHVFGDTAIAHGLETEKSSYKGADSSGQYRFTDVFVKRGGVWKAVATHVSKVAKH